MPKEAFIVGACLLLVSCGGAIPFPYLQTAPIPEFAGRIQCWGADEALVEVQGHPETRSVADSHGHFRTKEGSDFFFGMDQAYFPRSYRLTASRFGKIIGSWEIDRPPMLGRYPGQPEHGTAIELGDLQ